MIERFAFTGWINAGIYHTSTCSLRAARSEAVRMFPTAASAQSAGLKPCKTCKPATDSDADIALFDSLRRDVDIGVIRLGSPHSLARRANLTVSQLDDLLRDHAQLTAKQWIAEQAVRKGAHELLFSRRSIDDIAAMCGLHDADVFASSFATRMRMLPEDYRTLDASRGFSLTLPISYRAKEVLAYHARYPDSVSERSEGNRIWKALTTRDGAVVLELTLHSQRVEVRAHGDVRLSSESSTELHASAIAMLGLVHDVRAFERKFPALTRARRGLRLPLLPNAFDALCWGIIGQQINVRFAGKLRQVIIALAGEAVGTMRAHPTPQAIANLSADDLTTRQFSRAKTRYLIEAAQAVVEGRLDIEGLRLGSAIAAENALVAQHGIGVWTARYMLLRLGFADVAPIGDSALATALQRLDEMPERPDIRQTAQRMYDFSPYRSLATAHLWASLADKKVVPQHGQKKGD